MTANHFNAPGISFLGNRYDLNVAFLVSPPDLFVDAQKIMAVSSTASSRVQRGNVVRLTVVQARGQGFTGSD